MARTMAAFFYERISCLFFCRLSPAVLPFFLFPPLHSFSAYNVANRNGPAFALAIARGDLQRPVLLCPYHPVEPEVRSRLRTRV